ncbi:iron-sulfur protein NUBPL [Venturia canescens]|uniref:iron-sulfur protein NUBPL n=1 Tax=Venturia canescens TaxID=32260 RepID=UPI001C9BEAC9|nr:iron-sulfur protein NUBPL [Venturia canescens]
MSWIIEHFLIRSFPRQNCLGKCRNILYFSTSMSTVRTYKNDETRKKELMSRGLPKQKPIQGVKQILMIASGKGGVGKSTVSTNVATALKVVAPSKAIGLLDADIFGPTIPLMMNLHQSPMLTEDNHMEPLINYGVKCMSMGFLIEEKTPVIWRGLMVMSAIDRLLRQVAWSPLDYLVVDTPPGTGDTLLSLSQNLPITGVLLVTTPQKAATEVARRGAKMFQKLNIPIAGIVENMTSVSCPKCNHSVPLFGGGAASLADEIGSTILSRLPMHEDITNSSDKGRPIVLSAPNSIYAETYKQLAKDLIVFMEKQPKNTH